MKYTIIKPAKRLRLIYEFPSNVTYIGSPGEPSPCRSYGHDWPSQLPDIAFMAKNHQPEACLVCGAIRKQV